jgi:hypothetical protein
MIIVNDIGLAAYLRIIKGYDYVTTPRKNVEQHKFEFSFELSTEDFDKVHIEYLNSKYRIFDLEIKELKRVINN